MPFVTLTVRQPTSTGFKDKVFAAVHAALVATGVRAGGFDPENMMVAFGETSCEHGAFAGGRLLHA